MGLSVNGAIELWNGYEAHVMILLSLSYLAVDLVATAALGILSHGVGSDNKSIKEIQAFWAPFLLLHLGGPNTITAYSLEDNELWLRHLLGLVFQYGERTLVLRSSSAGQLIDLNSSAIVDSVREFPKANHLDEAYFLFERFKYLFAGFILNLDDGYKSFLLIRTKSTKEAFKLLEIELGFMFDVLYSKASIIYTRFGMILHCICLFSHVSTFVVFQTMIHKSVYPPIDISITYALIFGAIALEFKRWSISMRQYNLLSFCLKDISTPCTGFQKFNFVKDALHKYWYLTCEDVNDDLQEMIFEPLLRFRYKMEGDDGIDVKHCKEILAQRGDNCPEKFRWSITKVEFDHNLLFWHIATDLCYRVDLDHKHEDASQLPLACKICECLSNYMLYLLVVNPTMLPKGIGDIRQEIKGDNESQSMLHDGCRLAKELQSLESPNESPESTHNWNLDSIAASTMALVCCLAASTSIDRLVTCNFISYRLTVLY
ncbi:uncharacterized protein LOC123198936 [Mangifera indica]|uniref:uncharacterized protein LOC123198936 n=1 Tax=Mangifera indica TaxID=29780 RepID=UPI001CFA8D89|nr:uncharacterized protein LOC123198936 [Mangifera indica]